jgi:hypothetical protein
MEFGTPRLGSIKGGSVAKRIMYHYVFGEWRLAAPLRGMDPRDAWTELRGQLVGHSTPWWQATSTPWTISNCCDVGRGGSAAMAAR